MPIVEKLLGSGTQSRDATGKVVYTERFRVVIDNIGDDATQLVPTGSPPGIGVTFDRADIIEHRTPNEKVVESYFTTNGSLQLPPNVDDDNPSFSSVTMSTRDEIYEIPVFRRRYQSRAESNGSVTTVVTWEPDAVRVEAGVTDLIVTVNSTLSLGDIINTIQPRSGDNHLIGGEWYRFKGAVNITLIESGGTPLYQIRYRWTRHDTITTPTDPLPDVIFPEADLVTGFAWIRVPADNAAFGPVQNPLPRIILTRTSVDDATGFQGLPGNPI